MTKKKLAALVLICSFLFLGGTTFLNFDAAKQHTESQNEHLFFNSTDEIVDAMARFSESEEKDIEYLQQKLGGNFAFAGSEDISYSYALTDKQGNVVFESESGVWFSVDRDMQYISLEEYLTPEIKKDLIKFLKKSDGNSLIANKLSANFANGEYLPVSIEFVDNHFGGDEKENESITVEFSDLEITHTFDAADELTCKLYNLEDDKNYDKVNEKLKNEMKSFDYASEMHCSEIAPNEIKIVLTEGDCHFISFVKIDLNKMALNSSFFRNQMTETAIVFVILTAAALGIATAVFNKSVSKDKRTKEESHTEEEIETTIDTGWQFSFGFDVRR